MNNSSNIQITAHYNENSPQTQIWTTRSIWISLYTLEIEYGECYTLHYSTTKTNDYYEEMKLKYTNKIH